MVRRKMYLPLTFWNDSSRSVHVSRKAFSHLPLIRSCPDFNECICAVKICFKAEALQRSKDLELDWWANQISRENLIFDKN